jgi:hypothetical protein
MLIFNTFAGWLRWNCRRLKEYKSINTSQFSFTIPESLFADEMNEIEAKPASSIEITPERTKSKHKRQPKTEGDTEAMPGLLLSGRSSTESTDRKEDKPRTTLRKLRNAQMLESSLRAVGTPPKNRRNRYEQEEDAEEGCSSSINASQFEDTGLPGPTKDVEFSKLMTRKSTQELQTRDCNDAKDNSGVGGVESRMSGTLELLKHRLERTWKGQVDDMDSTPADEAAGDNGLPGRSAGPLKIESTRSFKMLSAPSEAESKLLSLIQQLRRAKIQSIQSYSRSVMDSVARREVSAKEQDSIGGEDVAVARSVAEMAMEFTRIEVGIGELYVRLRRHPLMMCGCSFCRMTLGTA